MGGVLYTMLLRAFSDSSNEDAYVMHSDADTRVMATTAGAGISAAYSYVTKIHELGLNLNPFSE